MVNLGDKVKDTVTGFEGVAVARHSYLFGCNRISVQPPVNGEGKVPDTSTFDEPQLEVLATQVISIPESISLDPGGPEKYMPDPKPEDKRR